MNINGVIAPESMMRALRDIPRKRDSIVTPVGLPVCSVISTCAAGFAAGMRIVPPYVPGSGPLTLFTDGKAVALGTAIGVK